MGVPQSAESGLREFVYVRICVNSSMFRIDACPYHDYRHHHYNGTNVWVYMQHHTVISVVRLAADQTCNRRSKK